jgi:hypothetical protein
LVGDIRGKKEEEEAERRRNGALGRSSTHDTTDNATLVDAGG